MKLSQLQELAKKVQLEIKSEETEYLLASFSKLEEMLAKFQQSQLKDSHLHQKQTKFTLGNLHQLTKAYSTYSIKQEIIRLNATVSAKSFLIIRKKKKTSNFVK